MKIEILTLFPEMFDGPFATSMIKKAKDIGAVEIKIHNLRDWATDNHKTVDDRAYGGGPGMIIKVDVMERAIRDIKKGKKGIKIILMDAVGKKFTQVGAKDLSKQKNLVFIAGHYEGFDERIREHLVDEDISIGDYILTGGEIPAMVITDAIVRLLPGVLEEEVIEHESFSRPVDDNKQPETLLDYPQYTRPEVYKGWKVPEVLLSGNHAEIKTWRSENALKRTKQKRPDLIKNKGV